MFGEQPGWRLGRAAPLRSACLRYRLVFATPVPLEVLRKPEAHGAALIWCTQLQIALSSCPSCTPPPRGGTSMRQGGGPGRGRVQGEFQ